MHPIGRKRNEVKYENYDFAKALKAAGVEKLKISICSQILDNKFREVLEYLAKEIEAIEATKIANLTGF